MKILNMARMHQKLKLIPEQVRTRAQADFMLGGREINMLQRSLAPKDDMVLVGTIRSEPLPSPEIGVVVRAGGPETTIPVRNAEKGNAPNYDYAFAQEFGTSKMQPNAFFYPGYHARKKLVQRQVRAGWKRTLKAMGTQS